MDSEYRRWMDENRHREQMARGIHTPPASTPTIVTTVAVPVLQALAIGLALALLGGGLPALFGTPLLLAGKLAVAGLVVGTAGATVVFIIQERGVHTTPARLAWEQMQQAIAPPAPPELDAEPWRVINTYRGTPLIASTATRLDTAVQPMEPDARPEIRELHDFVCACWEGGGGSLSRASCKARGWGRAKWETFVGGRRGRSGESAKGILSRAGVVVQDTTGWQWRDGITLGDVFGTIPELQAYADARAKMGLKRQDRTDRTVQDGPGDASGLSRTGKG